MGQQSYILAWILSMDSKASTKWLLSLYWILNLHADTVYLAPMFSFTMYTDWMVLSPKYFSDHTVNTVTSCFNQAYWLSECINEWKNELDVNVVKYG